MCYVHELVAATGSCHVCLRAACDVCTLFEGGRSVCPRCLPEVQARQRKNRRIVAMVGLAAVMASAVSMAWVASRNARAYKVWRSFRMKHWKQSPSQQPAGKYGYYSLAVLALKTQLQREPCDRPSIVRLSRLLLKAGANRETVNLAQAFFSRCGAYPRLRWSTYKAHMRLSEFAQAARDATRIIASNPDDHDFLWWRGEAYENQGDLARAAADYRRAISLKPETVHARWRLAGILQRQGRSCDAATQLAEIVTRHPKWRQKFELRIKELRTRGSCAPASAATP